jgi:hypothetical protein
MIELLTQLIAQANTLLEQVIICGFILPFYIIAAGVWYIAWKMKK